MYTQTEADIQSRLETIFSEPCESGIIGGYLRLAIGAIDLTSLNGTDTSASIHTLWSGSHIT